MDSRLQHDDESVGASTHRLSEGLPSQQARAKKGNGKEVGGGLPTGRSTLGGTRGVVMGCQWVSCRQTAQN
eukprot:scaffold20934_cov20-Tisochrysis_lutea.AAC.1